MGKKRIKELKQQIKEAKKTLAELEKKKDKQVAKAQHKVVEDLVVGNFMACDPKDIRGLEQTQAFAVDRNKVHEFGVLLVSNRGPAHVLDHLRLVAGICHNPLHCRFNVCI